MIETLLSRLLSTPDSPTADLYFRNACGDFLDGPVRQFGPTVFASEAACLVMRHALRAGPLPLRRRLIYMIDDDVDAGIEDESLPYLYRQKLRMVEQPLGRRMTRVAGVAVVASTALQRLFDPVMTTHLLRPFWSEPLASLSHFQSLSSPDACIDLAYLGSIVHRRDLEFLLPVFATLLARHENLRLHIPERHGLPAAFERHPRVRRIPGIGWTAYRAEIATRRFHITLYPLLDSPFNRARSGNKLIEHAITGAAPVYSSDWTESRRVGRAGAGICVPNAQDAWIEAVSQLIRTPERARDVASKARNLAAKLNDPEPQRQLWQCLFELKESAVA